MVRILVTWLGTWASVAGLIFTLFPTAQPVTASQGIFLGVVLAVLIAGFAADLYQYFRRRPKRYKTAAEITDYMYRWISSGGRAIIFTRDMSWANEPSVRELLFKKARARELTICLPDNIELTQELGAAGADIASYSSLGHVPQSRFTIINADRMDAHVAIGRRINDRHVIEEFSAGDHPVLAVTQDLVDIVRRIAAQGGDKR